MRFMRKGKFIYSKSKLIVFLILSSIMMALFFTLVAMKPYIPRMLPQCLANQKAISDNVISYKHMEGAVPTDLNQLWPVSSTATDANSYIRRQLKCPFRKKENTYAFAQEQVTCSICGSLNDLHKQWVKKTRKEDFVEFVVLPLGMSFLIIPVLFVMIFVTRA